MIAREIDFPPVWLAAFAIVGGLVAEVIPLFFPYSRQAGGFLVAFAIILALGAIGQLLWNRTTVIPGAEATRLVTTGLFRFSRNPIYLADVILLVGLYLYWGALLALPLVGVFMVVIRRRFIIPEEARLRQKFGPDFNLYKNHTRRWI